MIFASTNYGNYRARFQNGLFVAVWDGIRQGCPLSMAIYCLFIAPFLDELDSKLRSENLGELSAYADDWRIMVREQTMHARVNVLFLQTMEKFESVGQKIQRNKSLVYVWREISANVDDLKPYPEFQFVGPEEGIRLLSAWIISVKKSKFYL